MALFEVHLIVKPEDQAKLFRFAQDYPQSKVHIKVRKPSPFHVHYVQK